MSTVIDRPRAAAAPSRVGGAQEIFTPGALDFLAELHVRFDARRRELLAARVERQARFDAGMLPDFPVRTVAIRETDWTVGPIPADLQDRRVEITGPTNAKMVINALNSGARVFMADFEDATRRCGMNDTGPGNFANRGWRLYSPTPSTESTSHRRQPVFHVSRRGCTGRGQLTVDGVLCGACSIRLSVQNARAALDAAQALFHLPSRKSERSGLVRVNLPFAERLGGGGESKRRAIKQFRRV